MVTLAEALSETRTVNVVFPTADGVPLMVPVPALRVSPVGSDPELKDQVYGAVPPDAAIV